MALANVKVTVSGADEVRRKLRRLGAAIDKQATEAALRESAEPIIRTAKGKAPSDVIADGIQVVSVEHKNGGTVMEVGLPGGRKPWFHGLFIELGTGPRVQKKTGRRTGSMPADPFLRPAFDIEKRRAQAIYFAELKRRLELAAGG